ncbi:MAG: hypothetical protein D6761_09400 [Candidatus Dadabacteria bacterium]|nr:MAG: hypothetical protein D6761_09400 [Candidatus Dadabacteria bacterium]
MLLAGVSALLAACEVHPTSEALPFLEPGAGQAPGSVAAEPVTGEARVQPVSLFLGDGAAQEVVPLGPTRFYVSDGRALAEDARIGVTSTTAVDFTIAARDFGGAVLVESELALNVVTEPVAAVAPGRRLVRVIARGSRSIREPLQAIGHDGGDLVVTCPRRAEGAVWDEDARAWVAAIWQTARDGGCPVLRAPLLPTRD